MEKLNKSIRKYLFFSLGASVGFPVGILGIIFGAINGWFVVLALGIVLTVIGFYGMPLLWVKYADRRHDRAVMFMVEHEYIYTVSGIAKQTGYPEEDVRNRIMKMIIKHELVGYLFHDDVLELNENIKQTERIRPTRKCESCGAPMDFDGTKYLCEYCGSMQNE